MQLNVNQVTVMLPVRDVARARDFYERALALRTGEERPDGKIIYNCGGTEIALNSDTRRVSWLLLPLKVIFCRPRCAVFSFPSGNLVDYSK